MLNSSEYIKCSACGRTQIAITDPESGEVICSNCGLVMVKVVNEGNIDNIASPERRIFITEKQNTRVKTALLRLDVPAISRIDKKFPHPMLVKKLLTDSALTHATVFPLQNVSIPGLTNYHTIRKIVFDSIKDPSPPLYSGPMETLKWIAYQKWDGIRKNTTNFECPHCEEDVARLSYDSE